jgi:Zn-dependent protease
VIGATTISSGSLQNVVFLSLGLLLGLVVHEYVHALVALRFGDMSPKLAGRLTFNLRPHVEPFGTFVLPGILLLKVLFGQPPFVFGYAKPQPLHQYGFKRQDRQIILVSLAGPAANVALAVLFGVLFRLAVHATSSSLLLRLLADQVIVNVILAVMNLMPIPPLDGSRVVATLLPARPREVMTSLEPYGALFMLVIFFIISGPIFTFVKVIGNGICQLVAGGDCIFV